MSQAVPQAPPLREARPNPANAAIPLMALPLVMALLFVVHLVSGIRGADVQILGAALLLGIVCMVPMLAQRLLPQERRHVLISLFSLTYLVYFGLPAFTQYLWYREYSEVRIHLVNVAPEDILVGQFTALLGILCVLAGYMLPFGAWVSNALPKPRYEWSHGTALAVAIVMLPLGWAIFLGGQFGLVPKRAGSGVLGAIASSIYFGVALLGIIYMKYKSRPAVLIMLLLIPPMMLFSFFTGIKRLFLSPLIMIALSYIVMERRIRPAFIIGGFAVIVVLYPMAQFYREFVQVSTQVRSVEVLSDPARVMSLMSAFASQINVAEYIQTGIQSTGTRLDVLGIVSVIVRDTPDRVPFQGGWTILNVFLSFIPRLLWPGKPDITFGQWVTDHYVGPSTSSTGSSWVGEFYFNFGFPGVIIGMLVVGMYFRALHNTFFVSGATIPALLASVVILWTTCPAIEMNLIAPFSGLWFALAPIFLAHIMVRVLSGPQKRQRRPAHQWGGPPS
ncbi:MAG: hypothetical protein HKP30_07890 [Myxococcales bacterium]|nr:hypothetical protein [Myxococcales bacterium]